MADEQIVREIAAKVAEVVAREMAGIVPDRVYTPERAAELIGIDSGRRGKTIREIPPEMLPFVRVTPSKAGRIGYLGRDLLHYIESRRRTRPDAAA